MDGLGRLKDSRGIVNYLATESGAEITRHLPAAASPVVLPGFH